MYNATSERQQTMTKLIIQIPCYNEEDTLAVTLQALPRDLPGVDVVEWMIIDDGSTDRTVQVAHTNGVDHIVRLPCHQGLARAFTTGIEACLAKGANVIVNTDADNQYVAEDIEHLITPIIQDDAEIVVGARPISKIEHFSLIKKALQKIGSFVVRRASRTNIPDAPCGFRAYSRNAAMQLHVFNEYTYTLETIIQAGQKNMAITWVPIRTNRDLRPSRLIRSIPRYISQSFGTICRIFMTYRPFRFSAVPGFAALLIGILIGLRFVHSYLTGHGGGHVQSLILCALLIGTGFFLIVTGLIADLIAVNRKLLEKVDWRVQKLEESTRQESIYS
ncbi:MAG: glycosyltransferase family 2 protein [Pirellulales bacterium]